MALTAGAAVFEYGTAGVEVVNDTSAIASAAFNAGTITAFTNTNNAPLCDMSLDITIAVAPVAGKAIHVYRRDLNIDGANDATVPDANYKGTYVGSFKLDLVTSRQFQPLKDVPLTQEQEFYIENDSGQATTGTTVLKITSKSYNAFSG